jgi:hypothetical protein
MGEQEESNECDDQERFHEGWDGLTQGRSWPTAADCYKTVTTHHFWMGGACDYLGSAAT